MNSLKKLTLCGVHEQVNIPIIICQEQKIFEKHGLDVTFRIVPEGTGAILDLIDKEEVDIALCVTDAFIAGKSKGKILSKK